MEIVDEELHGEELAVRGGDEERRLGIEESVVRRAGVGALVDEHARELDAVGVAGPGDGGADVHEGRGPGIVAEPGRHVEIALAGGPLEARKARARHSEIRRLDAAAADVVEGCLGQLEVRAGAAREEELDDGVSAARDGLELHDRRHRDSRDERHEGHGHCFLLSPPDGDADGADPRRVGDHRQLLSPGVFSSSKFPVLLGHSLEGLAHLLVRGPREALALG
mmetsp:Transcript_372/g.1352  ORF Transcript_372/g.1352 Transcript_372/m.1352 type:complete len:223 (-) Transcript_372:168-836(-)